MKIEERAVKKNPCKMWKENREITIYFKEAGKQTFICCYDERNEKYFYSEEANHSYHSRLFNKLMDVIVYENVYSSEEMKEIALEKYLTAEKKRQQALEVINECMKDKRIEKGSTNLLGVNDEEI